MSSVKGSPYGAIEPVQERGGDTLHWLFTALDQECDHDSPTLCGLMPIDGGFREGEWWDTDTDWPQMIGNLCRKCWRLAGELLAPWPGTQGEEAT